MQTRLRQLYATFDRQFWVLMIGTLINSTGFSFVFPFLSIYLTERLGLTLTMVGGLIALNAATGLIAQTVGGSLADRLGRKVVMVISILGSSVVIACWGFTSSLPVIAGLILLNGLINPLFQPASQAMIADLVGPVRRAEAFSLMRVAHNLGVVIGPSLGGFVATRSYQALFLIAAAAGLTYFIILVWFTRETRPGGTSQQIASQQSANQPGANRQSAIGNQESDGGYRQVLQDRALLAFCGAMVLIVIVYSQTWTIFPVYLKSQYGIPENQYGLLTALNAAMVVTMQFAVTRITSRFPRAEMMALGAFLYAIGVGTIGWSDSYWRFALNIVILTLGEMVLIPTGAAFVANLAPLHLRGRYMAIQGLATGIGFGAGPLLGGTLADRLGPARAWPVLLVLGLVSTAGFLGLRRTPQGNQTATTEGNHRAD